jgi:hypothetical protein
MSRDEYREFENISNFIELLRVEKSLKPTLIEMEGKRLAKLLKEEKNVKGLKGIAYYEYLKDSLKRKGAVLDACEIENYFRYLDIRERVNYFKMLEEMDEILYKTKANYLKGWRSGTELLYAERYLQKLGKIINNEAILKDVEDWRD